MTISERKKYDKNMLLALFPLMLCGAVLHGARVWLLCGVAVLTAKAADVLMSMILKTEYDSADHSSELAALTFTLMLPVNVPFYAMIMPIVITIMVGKHLFGGRDVYPFNLAALAMCCAAVNWDKEVLGAVTPFAKVNLISGYTAGATVSNAGIIKSGGVPPYDTIDMLMGNYPGVMGADFVLVIIVIGIFMMARKKINWQVPVSFLITCAVISFAFPRIYGFSRLESLELEMLNGSVFFVALFMLADPTTTPKTPKAKIAFGVITGVLGMIFRYAGGFNIGTCFALLLVNTMDGYIERAFSGNKDGKKEKAAENVNPQTQLPYTEQHKQVYKAASGEDKQSRKEKRADVMDIISEAEDKIDNVIYSTRTISIDEILKAEAEMKRKKEGK